jgi:hypothetical protein
LHYFTGHSANLGSGGVLTAAITVPDTAKMFHFIWSASTIGPGTLEVREDVSSFTGGTTFEPKNNNRRSSNVSALAVKFGDTGTVPIVLTGGTLLYPTFPLGVAGGLFESPQGGLARDDDELLLKPGIYGFKFTATAAGVTATLVMKWYEYTPLN